MCIHIFIYTDRKFLKVRHDLPRDEGNMGNKREIEADSYICTVKKKNECIYSHTTGRSAIARYLNILCQLADIMKED